MIELRSGRTADQIQNTVRHFLFSFVAYNSSLRKSAFVLKFKTYFLAQMSSFFLKCTSHIRDSILKVFSDKHAFDDVITVAYGYGCTPIQQKQLLLRLLLAANLLSFPSLCFSCASCSALRCSSSSRGFFATGRSWSRRRRS